jgi:hypothetical protein
MQPTATAPRINPFQKAVRHRAKLRIAVCGPSGSGKTFSALRMALGVGGRVALIDTEKSSAELYAGEAGIPKFDCVNLTPPYSPERYIELLKASEEFGYDVVIIDSLSHAWAGTGGILDMQALEEVRQRNGFRAWREITPKHNELVDAMLGCSCHLIATMRSKQEWLVDKDGDGKTQIKKHGLAPIQREGMEYEFTLTMDMNMDHKATVSKTRINFMDKKVFVPTEKDGEAIRSWLDNAPEDSGDTEAAKPRVVRAKAE